MAHRPLDKCLEWKVNVSQEIGLRLSVYFSKSFRTRTRGTVRSKRHDGIDRPQSLLLDLFRNLLNKTRREVAMVEIQQQPGQAGKSFPVAQASDHNLLQVKAADCHH